MATNKKKPQNKKPMQTKTTPKPVVKSNMKTTKTTKTNSLNQNKKPTPKPVNKKPVEKPAFKEVAVEPVSIKDQIPAYISPCSCKCKCKEYKKYIVAGIIVGLLLIMLF